MSSPLDSNFFNKLNRCASRKLELCTLRFAAIFHEEGSWSKSNLNSNQPNHKARGEEKCQKSKKFKVQSSTIQLLPRVLEIKYAHHVEDVFLLPKVSL